MGRLSEEFNTIVSSNPQFLQLNILSRKIIERCFHGQNHILRCMGQPLNIYICRYMHIMIFDMVKVGWEEWHLHQPFQMHEGDEHGREGHTTPESPLVPII